MKKASKGKRVSKNIAQRYKVEHLSSIKNTGLGLKRKIGKLKP